MTAPLATKKTSMQPRNCLCTPVARTPELCPTRLRAGSHGASPAPAGALAPLQAVVKRFNRDNSIMYISMNSHLNNIVKSTLPHSNVTLGPFFSQSNE